VTIIAFLLPPGGAVVTIWNLHRFSQLDSVRTRQLTIAVIGIFALGFALLLGLATPTANGVPAIDANASSILSVGIALACFVAQRSAYRMWRARNLRTRTSSWLGAFGWAVVFSLLTAIAALPVYAIVASLFGTGPKLGVP
jgi:hypothetical protein